MENLEAGGMEISTLLNNVSKISNSVGIEGNYSEKSSEKLYRNEVSPCVNPVVQAAVGEAKERLKKIEQEYECAYKKYRQLQSNMYMLYKEGKGPEHYSHWAGYCIYHCKNLVKQLRNVLGRLNAEEATQQGAETPNHFRYIQREIPRSSSNKHVHDLLSRLKETNRLRETATVGGAMLGNPTSQDSIHNSTSIVIKLLMKIMEELEKEKGETNKVLGEKRRIEKGYTEKMRQLQEKREHLCKKWDDERKYMLGLNNTPDELLYFLPDFQRWMH